MRFLCAIAVAAALLSAAGAARAEITVTVDKTSQRLRVDIDGARRYDWPVSTARWGYRTPNGSYRPERLERKWFSRKYDWSPMPWSIFFSGGYAIHGSYEVSRLGRPASHGCIRLHPNNAKILFELVQSHVRETRIVVTGEGPPAARHEAAASVRKRPARAEGDDTTFRNIFAPNPFYGGPGAH
jgi:lipoprotein-anchoring transpeptidase ErfK/SrfK